MSRRIEFTVETDQVLVIKKPGGKDSVWCPECRTKVTMITPEAAATLAGVTTRTIYRQAEDGKIHFMETPEGLLLVCLNSFQSFVD